MCVVVEPEEEVKEEEGIPQEEVEALAIVVGLPSPVRVVVVFVGVFEKRSQH